MKKHLYFLDDDPFLVQSIEQVASDFGIGFKGFVEIALFEKKLKRLSCPTHILIDLGIPPGRSRLVSLEKSKAGTEAGVVLARVLKSKWPTSKIGLLLGRPSLDVRSWCLASGVEYHTKPISRASIERFCDVRKQRIFVVHGRDTKFLSKVEKCLNQLNMTSIVLFRQPNHGRTVIEKFEQASDDCDACVILMSPDDIGGLTSTTKQLARSRQNVILEMGYFLGKFGRSRGRVVLIENGSTELPSDIAGIVRIDGNQKMGALKTELAAELSPN